LALVDPKVAPMRVNEFEPTVPAEAVQALFKASNGNVCMQTRLGKRGWERSLLCEDCNKRQSVEALIVLEKDDEAAFARILKFCADHRHDAHGKYKDPSKFATVALDSGRRIKDGI
jgi:hypothetical protein